MKKATSNSYRGKGIQAKGGKLYILINKIVVGSDKNTYKRQWIPTGLNDTKSNVDRAKKLRQLELVKPNKVAPLSNISLSDYCNNYLSVKKRALADTTFATYSHHIYHIKIFFKDIALIKVNEQKVQDFLDYLLEDGKRGERTASDIKATLNAIIKEAISEGIISHNPVAATKLSPALIRKYAKPKDKENNFFDYEEAMLFISYARDSNYYAFFLITLIYGLRREEAMGIKWSAINTSTMKLTINHTVTKGTKINHDNATKTEESTRTYPLTTEILDALNELRSKEAACRKALGSKFDKNDYVFKNYDNNGKLYYPDSFSKAFKALLKKHPDLPQSVTLHGLRTSCVSLLVHEGWDVKSIQKWVGQKDFNVTMDIYAKVKGEKVKKEILADLINTLFPDSNK